MKRLPSIFILSKTEQRVVLIIMLALIAGAFAGYERRVHQSPPQPAAATKLKMSPSPPQSEDEQ